MSLNVRREEGIVWDLHRYIKTEDRTVSQELLDELMEKMCFRKELLESKKAAIREMQEILNNKENSSGYHINHIRSGKKVWDVFRRDGKAYSYLKEYSTREEAEANLKGDAYIEANKHEDGHETYEIWVLDETMTADMKEQNVGSYVSTFDTRDEAEAEAQGLGDAFVQERFGEEYWSVVNTKTGEMPFKMLFPSVIRALVFLYQAAKPECWTAYRAKYEQLYPAQKGSEE